MDSSMSHTVERIHLDEMNQTPDAKEADAQHSTISVSW